MQYNRFASVLAPKTPRSRLARHVFEPLARFSRGWTVKERERQTEIWSSLVSSLRSRGNEEMCNAFNEALLTALPLPLFTPSHPMASRTGQRTRRDWRALTRALALGVFSNQEININKREAIAHSASWANGKPGAVCSIASNLAQASRARAHTFDLSSLRADSTHAHASTEELYAGTYSEVVPNEGKEERLHAISKARIERPARANSAEMDNSPDPFLLLSSRSLETRRSSSRGRDTDNEIPFRSGLHRRSSSFPAGERGSAEEKAPNLSFPSWRRWSL